MTKILVLVGPHGGGKDYYADNVVKEDNIKIDFKDKLLEMLSIYENLPLTDKVFYEQWKKHPENRRKLQAFGTEVIRNHVNDNFWVEQCYNKVTNSLKEKKLIINRDTRFSNEFKMWKELYRESFATCIEFKFMNYHNLKPGYSDHPSERAAQELIKGGYKHGEILNNTSIKEIIEMGIK